MRGIVASIAIHLVILLACWPSAKRAPSAPSAATTTTATGTVVVELVEIVDQPPAPAPSTPSSGGGAIGTGPRHVASRNTVPATAHAKSAWDDVTISMDGGAGTGASGAGGGTGDGHGRGIGFGAGDGIARTPEVPPPPPAPKASLARPARLLRPARERETIAEKLFVARVTVDEEGDVVGAHLVKYAPGRSAELAASAVWQFHYDPARDDDGRPVRSTFEQQFQIW